MSEECNNNDVANAATEEVMPYGAETFLMLVDVGVIAACLWSLLRFIAATGSAVSELSNMSVVQWAALVVTAAFIRAIIADGPLMKFATKFVNSAVERKAARSK